MLHTIARTDLRKVAKFHFINFLKNIDVCKKWVTATKRDGFVSSDGSYICGEHFTKDDYLFVNSKKLKDGAISSVFPFPSHIQSNSFNKRKQPSTRIYVPPSKKVTLEEKKGEPLLVSRGYCIWKESTHVSRRAASYVMKSIIIIMIV